MTPSRPVLPRPNTSSSSSAVTSSLANDLNEIGVEEERGIPIGADGPMEFQSESGPYKASFTATALNELRRRLPEQMNVDQVGAQLVEYLELWEQKRRQAAEAKAKSNY